MPNSPQSMVVRDRKGLFLVYVGHQKLIFVSLPNQTLECFCLESERRETETTEITTRDAPSTR